VIERRGKAVALFPLFEHRFLFATRIGSPIRGAFSPFMGLRFLGGVSDKKDAYEAMVRAVMSFGCCPYVEMGFSSRDASYIPAEVSGPPWRTKTKYTYVVALPPDLDSAWLSLESRARNMVRKAEKNCLKVRPLTGSKTEVRAFHRMLEVTFARSGLRPPYSLAFYEAFLAELRLHDRVLFLSAEHKDEPVAFGVFPFNSSEIHYVSGASSPLGKSMAANSLIQWEVFRFAVGRGLRRYDLGGGGIPSIDRFKASFRGTLETYTHHFRIEPWLENAFKAYHVGRDISAKLRMRLRGRPAA
jgi:lipid II:glycine glycyltransferase (peptidoglycan interpeptide bridge formation enzyme)